MKKLSTSTVWMVSILIMLAIIAWILSLLGLYSTSSVKNEEIVISTGSPAEAFPSSVNIGVDILTGDSGTVLDAGTADDSGIPMRPLDNLVIEEEEIIKINVSEKMTQWRLKTCNGIWFECGKRYTKEEITVASINWADAIVDAAYRTKFKVNDKWVTLDYKELLGVISVESKFDRCAIGPVPRKYAYSRNLLQRKKNTYSYTLEELKTLFDHPYFGGFRADIGPGQIVKKVGRGGLPWEKAKEYFSLNPGVYKVAKELGLRGKMYNTATPSDRWPGSRRHEEYYAKALGEALRILW